MVLETGRKVYHQRRALLCGRLWNCKAVSDRHSGRPELPDTRKCGYARRNVSVYRPELSGAEILCISLSISCLAVRRRYLIHKKKLELLEAGETSELGQMYH